MRLGQNARNTAQWTSPSSEAFRPGRSNTRSPRRAASIALKKKSSPFRNQITVWGTREQVLAQIEGRLSFFKSRYEFTLPDGTIYHFESQDAWKGVYACDGGKEHYVLYSHKGLNYSIFQDDTQIAAFTKNRFHVGNEDQYDLRMNDDANLLAIVCVVLIVDASQNAGGGATLNVDFGNVGPEAKPFDKSWEPS